MSRFSVWGKGEKSRRGGRKRVRACRQTFGTVVPRHSLCIGSWCKLLSARTLTDDKFDLNRFFLLVSFHPFPKQRACSQANSNAMISSSCQRKQGGAAFVWARHLYIEEPERELSDNNFYQQQNRDYIINNNNTVSRVIKAAILEGERQE